jgi:hypothetical protein
MHLQCIDSGESFQHRFLGVRLERFSTKSLAPYTKPRFGQGAVLDAKVPIKTPLLPCGRPAFSARDVASSDAFPVVWSFIAKLSMRAMMEPHGRGKGPLFFAPPPPETNRTSARLRPRPCKRGAF